MMRVSLSSVLVSALVGFWGIERGLSFTTTPTTVSAVQRRTWAASERTPLHMAREGKSPSNFGGKKTATFQTQQASACVVGWLAAAVFMFSDIDPAFAAVQQQQQPDFDSGSQVLLARGGRSGGRMGGRARSASMGRSSGSVSRTRVQPVRTVRSPGVIVAPGPFGFTPFSPFGYGFGFGGGIGDTIRDYGQDNEIARERAELENARVKNAELEQRILQLEQASKGGGGAPVLQQVQPVQQQQQQPVLRP